MDQQWIIYFLLLQMIPLQWYHGIFKILPGWFIGNTVLTLTDSISIHSECAEILSWEVHNARPSLSSTEMLLHKEPKRQPIFLLLWRQLLQSGRSPGHHLLSSSNPQLWVYQHKQNSVLLGVCHLSTAVTDALSSPCVSLEWC